uniref:Uncharacterized protein n=1 Tax=Macaca fascicularis TaxID=9541 RepID=A0A7N9C743_MACFA
MSWISFSFHTGRHAPPISTFGLGASSSLAKSLSLVAILSGWSLTFPQYTFFFSPQRVPSLMSPSGIKCTLKKGAGWIFKRRGALRLDPEGSSPSHSQPVCSTPHTEEDYCFSFTWSFPSTWC